MNANDGAAHTTGIAIVGAGPAGLTMALALASRGIGSVLAGPPADPSDTRTTALLDGTVRLLDGLGVWERARRDAAPLRRLKIADATQRLIRARPLAFEASEIGLEAFGWNIANRDLLAALLARLRDQSLVTFIEERVEAVSIGLDEATLVLEGGRPVKAKLAIAADGSRSKLRDAAGISAKTWRYPQVALTLNLEHTLPNHDASIEFHTETGPFTLVPLGTHRSSLVCVIDEAQARGLAALDDESLALELERRCRSCLGAFKIAGGRSVWPLGGLKAGRLADRRVALIGEAAHVFPPIGAQGFNLTCRDIASLARLVAHEPDPGSSAVLQAYDRARRDDVALTTLGVDWLNRSLLSSALFVQGARAAGLAVLDTIGPLRRWVMRSSLAPRSAGGFH